MATAGGHVNPVAPVLAGIVIILLLAKIGGDLFERISMPAVLGELLVGVLLGNAALLTGWMDGQPVLDAVHGFAEQLEFLKAPPETGPGNPLQCGRRSSRFWRRSASFCCCSRSVSSRA